METTTHQNLRQHGTGIAPEILQQFLDSATNAAQKGQSQFFTPVDFGRSLAMALPAHRPVIVDLNCGNGQLLEAAINRTTHTLLGADIDPRPFRSGSTIAPSKIAHDLTLLYPMLAEVNWLADLFVLNPPWGLRWHRARLAALAESARPAVRMAFKETDGMGADTIDSTVATLLIALDRCSDLGEGMLIANESTLQRLLFAPGAPHSALAEHIWWHQVFDGNPMTGIKDHAFSDDGAFQTGVIWFAAGHRVGPNPDPQQPPVRRARRGAVCTDFMQTETTRDRWVAVREEVLQQTRASQPEWNLYLRGGVIRTHLSLFQQHSRKVDKAEAKKLHELNGKNPMQLILQRTQRELLLASAGMDGNQSPWRVQPELQDAVRAALQDYNLGRAPLYPLGKIQRLGHLDEQSHITCEKDLADGLFLAGKTYELSSRTVSVTRSQRKPNLNGELEDIEISGQELMFSIKDERGEWRSFMGSNCRHEKIKVENKPSTEMIDFTTEQLAGHFIIPDVPDVAQVYPDKFEQNKQQLRELESFFKS